MISNFGDYDIDMYGKQIFRVHYLCQHEGDTEPIDEWIDFLLLKKRINAYKVFLQEKEARKKKNRQTRAGGEVTCRHCAGNHKYRQEHNIKLQNGNNNHHT